MKLRWKELIIAFLMALVLWYGVTGSEKIESQVDVRVDYRGLPQGLVVRSGFVNKVSVRVRAPGGMLASLTARDYAFFMDLSKVQKGENTLPINLDYLPFRGGVEVIDVTPSRIVLEVDSQASKTVPLEAKISGKLPSDYTARVTFEPSEITVNGPSTVLDELDIITVPVALEDPVIPGTTESRRVLPLPDGVDASRSEVKMSLTVGIKRKQVKITRTVQVDVPASLGKFVRPDKVSVTVSVPESVADKVAANAALRAFVQMERQDLGSYTLPVRVSLPEGYELVGIDPARVTVTLEQKQQTTPAPRKK